MDNKNQMVKKVLATSLAANVFLGGANVLKTENVASAWWWSQKHTQEEINSIYDDVKRDLQVCLEDSKNLDDSEKAQSFIQAILNLDNEYTNKERSYNDVIKFQKELKSIQSKVDLELNLQEVSRRKKAEEAEQEASRIENEHRRKLEEQKLQMEKEERERLEQINNAKASLSEKVYSIMRSAHKEVEFPENIEHIDSIADEIEEKIQSIDNLNRVDGVETLISELQAEIEKVLKMEKIL